MNDTADALRLFVERIERVSEEIAGLQEDRRDIYAEAKACGFSPAIIRKVIARRALAPADRELADAELAIYEAALDGADVSEAMTKLRPDAAALAASMLAEQIAGIDDPATAEALVEHIAFLLDLRAEIAALRAQESDRKKMAGAEGFEAKQIAVAVRWFEKCAKHGEDAMRAGEATFDLYRATFDAHDGAQRSPTEDPKLAAVFTPPTKKTNAKGRALDAARFAAMQTRRALEDKG
ncbi:DUF2312 domain-containing protein [Croceicoccus sp. BE223]|uniref:DUF2312 domain-containing protein n=1 Tax=Croceicoccus sp. BE223 TaxID=2817716 RepID=UPI00286197B2|nr:DUF2312 domain-containing protein [Croceicoccus sp. BE223]MDR7101509.1 uncharacterized protein (UPF0335 family) [Croceicoccus sp. BE223]